MRVQLLPSPAMPALPGTHYSWVGWSNVRKFLAQGNQPLVLPHIPQGRRNVSFGHIFPGNSVRGTYFPRKFCPTRQDILSILG